MTLSSLAAPKPAKSDSTEPDRSGAQDDHDVGAIEPETIEPLTGEIIVLAQHKPAAKATAAAEEQVTPLAKPEKRKSATGFANGKLKTKPAADGTTPETTATAKSNAGAKTGAGSGAKSAEVLAANEARKARKAAAKAKDKAQDKAKAARGKESAKAGKGGAKAKKAAGR